MNYWEFGDYLGVGAGAHSKITTSNSVTRLVKHKQPKRYMEAVAIGDSVSSDKIITSESLPFEFFMNALRLNGGVPRSLFEKRTALPIDIVESQLVALERRGLMNVSEGFIRTTPLGMRFLNEVLQEFL